MLICRYIQDMWAPRPKRRFNLRTWVSLLYYGNDGNIDSGLNNCIGWIEVQDRAERYDKTGAYFIFKLKMGLWSIERQVGAGKQATIVGSRGEIEEIIMRRVKRGYDRFVVFGPNLVRSMPRVGEHIVAQELSREFELTT